MKKYLLLPAFVLCLFSFASAQENRTGQTTPPRLETADSIRLMCAEIDKISLFDLEKMRESFIYRCRIQPTEFNKEVLAYIEKRRATLK